MFHSFLSSADFFQNQLFKHSFMNTIKVSNGKDKAIVGGPAGPAMAGPLFFAGNGFSQTTFLAKYVFLQGRFFHVSF